MDHQVTKPEAVSVGNPAKKMPLPSKTTRVRLLALCSAEAGEELPLFTSCASKGAGLIPNLPPFASEPLAATFPTEPLLSFFRLPLLVLLLATVAYQRAAYPMQAGGGYAAQQAAPNPAAARQFTGASRNERPPGHRWPGRQRQASDGKAQAAHPCTVLRYARQSNPRPDCIAGDCCCSAPLTFFPLGPGHERRHQVWALVHRHYRATRGGGANAGPWVGRGADDSERYHPRIAGAGRRPDLPICIGLR